MNITLSVERVKSTLSSLAGEEVAGAENLCIAATGSITAMLKKGGDYLKRESELIYAAACLAFYRYTLSRQSEGVSGYKAGDITVSNNVSSAVKAAKALYLDALSAVADCLVVGNFKFKAI